MARKKPDTTKVPQNTVPVSLTVSNPSEFPLVYAENTWDIVTNDDTSLKSLLVNTGQYDQHTINETLAGIAAGAANITYDYDTTESVFDPNTDKGIPSATAYVKVPSYYYTTFNNTEDVGGVPTPLDPPAHSFMIPITDCGNCPIVQVVQDGHVVYCDIDINIGTGVVTISWSNNITVDTTHPLYVSVIG